MAEVEVDGERRAGSMRRYTVRVAGRSYDVGISDADLGRLAPGADARDLVRESFRFLLDRESPESILQRFDLPVISRYFPDYAEAMRRRFPREAS